MYQLSDACLTDDREVGDQGLGGAIGCASDNEVGFNP